MLHHVAWWLKNLTELESFAAGRSLQELADDLGR
jgi:hypothetical protein